MSDTAVKNGFFSREMLHNGKMELLKQKKSLIVLTVLHMAGVPMVLCIAMVRCWLGMDYDEVEAYAFIGAISTIVALLSGMFCAINSMPYLFKRTEVDTRLSLPMSAPQRFVSDLLAGLCHYMAPFTLSMLVSWAIVLLGHITCDGRVIYREGWTETIHIFVEVAPYLARAMLVVYVMMLLYYMLTVLVMSCCGSLLETIVYTLLLNCLIPGAAAVITGALTSEVRGLVWDHYLQFVLPFTSPLGALIYTFPLLEDEPAFIGLGLWIVITVAVALIFGLIAFLAYRRRKAEDTGKPIVFELFYHVIMTLSLVTLIFLFLMMDDDLFVPAIIVTALFYFVTSVIKNRGFKNFGKSVGRYLITSVSCFVMIFVIHATESFGAASRVPSANSVSCAYISYTGKGGYDECGFGGMFYSEPLSNITCIKDRDDIELLTELHREMADRNYIYGRDTDHGEVHNFRILYKMKSGNWILREYRMTERLYSRLAVLDAKPDMRMANVTRAKEFLKDMRRNAQKGSGQSCYLVEKWVHYETYNNGDPEGVYKASIDSLPRDFADKLVKHYENDIMNMTDEQYLNENVKTYRLVTSLWSDGIQISEYCTETLTYLESLGIRRPDNVVHERQLE